MNALTQEPVASTLDRLHRAARGDWKHFVGIAPRALWRRFRGASMMQAIAPSDLSGAYIPVNREAGRFLYVLARAIEAERVVEFGTSFGISTIYLAAAARGAVVVADNANFPDTRPYLDHVRAPSSGFVTSTLFGGTMELAYFGGEEP